MKRQSFMYCSKLVRFFVLVVCFGLVLMPSIMFGESAAAKPSPDKVLAMLKDGNKRFVKGNSTHPHTNAARLKLAGTKNQGDYAYATVITCSDSRVPVELIFDAGIMDIFVIRVAGNVCDVDENGSIEYGLAHVNTPVLVVLGHTQCGAVTAVTHAVHGKGHALERNIPPLVNNIEPAVKRAIKNYPQIHGDKIIPYAIEENVWQSIEDLFMESPSTRNLVASGKAKVVGAIYDVGTGKVEWLPESKVKIILNKVNSSPKRAINAMASGGHGKDHHHGDHGTQLHLFATAGIITDDSFSFDPFTWSVGILADYHINDFLILSPECSVVFSEWEFKHVWLAPAVLLNYTNNSFFVGAGITKWFGLGDTHSHDLALKINAGYNFGNIMVMTFIETAFNDLFKHVSMGLNFGLKVK